MNEREKIIRSAIPLFQKSEILYVEDDPHIQSSTAAIFEKVFKKVFVAHDGQEGLELYHTHKKSLSLIFTDITMPNMDGTQMIKQIRQENKYIPIIIATGADEADIFLKLLKLSINDIMVKPMKIQSTLIIISQELQKAEDAKTIAKQAKELENIKTLLDHNSIISYTDQKGVITYANDFFCEISGYSKEELIGQPHNITRHEDMPKEVFKELWNTIKSGEIWQGEVKNRAKDGSAYFVDAWIMPVFDNEGNIVQYIAARYLTTDHVEEKEQLNEKHSCTLKVLKETKINSYKKMTNEKAQVKEEVKKQMQEELEALSFYLQNTQENLAKEKELKARYEQQCHHSEKEYKALESKHIKELKGLRDELFAYQQEIKSLREKIDLSKEETQAITKQSELAQKNIKDLEQEKQGLLKRLDEYKDLLQDSEKTIDSFKQSNQLKKSSQKAGLFRK